MIDSNTASETNFIIFFRKITHPSPLLIQSSTGCDRQVPISASINFSCSEMGEQIKISSQNHDFISSNAPHHNPNTITFKLRAGVAAPKEILCQLRAP